MFNNAISQSSSLSDFVFLSKLLVQRSIDSNRLASAKTFKVKGQVIFANKRKQICLPEHLSVVDPKPIRLEQTSQYSRRRVVFCAKKWARRSIAVPLVQLLIIGVTAGLRLQNASRVDFSYSYFASSTPSRAVLQS